MAILTFQKPDKVLMLETDSFHGKFEFRPLEPGYGITIGNALRRILLSSLEGYAFSSLKIDGVNHEFASIPGVLEDVTNIVLNLKQVRFKRTTDDDEIEKVNIHVSGTDVFRAGDIGKQIAGFEILNPNQQICHLDPKASFHMELTINKGRGYVPAEENADPLNTDINVIALDSI
ncbi:MAG: DNA-directed RNA polymerase subunit alpha, partial [Tannerella sp.]|nr:DNA-directed RNA polymerase subunit alpha [Tannerella sp.]